MSAHTPGPWIVEARSNKRGQQLPPRVTADGRGEIVATLGCFSTRGANAHLIAAAPDLLDALRGMLGMGPSNGGVFTQKAEVIARAAIEKAEGREP